MENLATIQTVKNVRHHPGADALDLVQILGWKVVTKRDEFKENDLAVYIAIDTIVPEKPDFEFLRDKHFRIKPIKLRKEESAGIAFPLSILTNFGYDMRGPIMEGLDVTNVIGVKKYEKPIPAELIGLAFGGLPGFLIMTDEDNLRSYPDAIPELYGRPYYITRKDDGCSGTFFVRSEEFGVCSRKVHLKESETNGYWRMAKKYDIANALKKAFPDVSIALQGEVYGEGIQKNPLGIKGIDFSAFNLFDISKRIYLDYESLNRFTKDYNIPMVHTIDEGSAFHYTLDELIQLSNKQKYPMGNFAEGIVVRGKEPFLSNVLDKYWSGKIISENYKEKD